jgi:hypothetical protein
MIELPARGPLTIHYPTDTHVRLEGSRILRPRSIRVLSVRDLVAQPLTPEEFLRRPFVRRSRYLLRGYENGQYRQFYLGCSEEFRAPSQLRIALYEPGKLRPTDLLSRPFEPSVLDRKQLARLLIKCQERDFGQLTLRVFTDDFGLVG